MNIFLLLNTLRNLRLRQVVYQLRYRLCKAKYCELKVSHAFTTNLLTCTEKMQCFDGEKFYFINIADEFKSWSYTEHGMLWAYNLNYMDWLLQDNINFEQGEEWIDRFIADLSQNSVGLDSYPIALRGINWIKFISRYQSKINKGKLWKWNDSLYSQYVLLVKKLEYHLLGNHLLEDAYSLFIAAIYFRDQAFYKKATKLLFQELNEQILLDGAHYEQSPMYHCILLDRLLDCCNISVNNICFEGQEKVNAFLFEKAKLMLGHLESICYLDGTYPLFNDSARGIAPTTNDIKDYASRLGIQWTPIRMKECGYRKIENNSFEGFVDIGNITASYQPGHSHADTFNYELRVNGQPFIVDTGISTYNKTERRQFERSTSAHNTVSVNGKNSSEVWGGFRVGKRAKVKILEDNVSLIKAFHDGFGKKFIHQRSFSFNEKSFLVEDEISQKCNAVSFIHLAPNVEILLFNTNEIITNKANIHIEGADCISIEDNFISVKYNEFHSSKVVKIQFGQSVKYKILS